jgi:hypothetical protein
VLQARVSCVRVPLIARQRRVFCTAFPRGALLPKEILTPTARARLDRAGVARPSRGFAPGAVGVLVGAAQRTSRYDVRMRVLIGLVVAVWVVFSAVPAFACGEWHMTDNEKKLDVDYLINAARIKKGDKNYASIYLNVDGKHPMRVVRDKQVVFDIKDGKLLKLGKPVGTLDKGTLTIGKKTFAIALTLSADGEGGPTGESYNLTVKSGDKVVVEGEHLYAMCQDVVGSPRDEITRRVVFYLAWRELGA